MRIFVALVGLLFSSTLLAQNVPSLGQVQARLIENFNGYKALMLVPGTFESCRMSAFPDANITTYDCNASTAFAVLAGETDPQALNMPFNTVHIQVKAWQGKWIKEFTFVGTYNVAGGVIPNGAKVVLDVWFPIDDESRVHGVWSLPDYNVSKALFSPTVRKIQ